MSKNENQDGQKLKAEITKDVDMEKRKFTRPLWLGRTPARRKTRKKKVPTKKSNVVFQPARTHIRNKSRTAILEANSSQSKGKDDIQQDQNDQNDDNAVNISADQNKVIDGAGLSSHVGEFNARTDKVRTQQNKEK